MRRRSVALVIAAAMVLIAIVLLVAPEREPRYQGRTLSEWLVQAQTNLFLADRGEKPTDGYSPAAVQAVREIGPRAVPELVGWIKRPLPLFQEELRAFRNLVPMPSGRAGRGRYRADLAVLGFRLLGPRASDAAPELTRLMKEQNVLQQTREAAMASLAHLGPAGLQPLLDAFADPSQPSRRLAGYYIGSMRDLGTSGPVAVVGLVRLLKDDEEQIAGRAATALGDLGLEPALAIPALTNALKDPRPFVRMSAVGALGNYRAQARVAIPALREALGDPKLQVRAAATNALSEIEMRK